MIMRKILKVIIFLILSFSVLYGCSNENLVDEHVADIIETNVEGPVESDVSNISLNSSNEEMDNSEGIDNSLKWDWIVEPGIYEDMLIISENLIALKDGEGKYKVINVIGEDVFHDKYDDINKFSEGVVLVEINGEVVYINENGLPISEATYENGYSFSESFAAVEQSNKWGFIQLDGSLVIQFKFEGVKSFHEELAAIKLNSKWGFIDTLGQIVIEPEFEEVEDFHEGVAAVKKNGKWGFIDNENKIISDFIYDDVKNFSEGYAAVKKDGKWGFVNSGGTVCIDLKYDDAGNFSEGIVSVKLNNYIEGMDAWAYVDEDDNIAINYDPYDASDGRMIWVGEFNGDYAFVSKTLYTIIDSDGKNIFNWDTEFFISVLDYNKKYDVIPGYIFVDESMRSRKYGLVGLNGECRLEPVFDYIYGVFDSFVVVDMNIDGNLKKGIIKIYNE